MDQTELRKLIDDTHDQLHTLVDYQGTEQAPPEAINWANLLGNLFKILQVVIPLIIPLINPVVPPVPPPTPGPTAAAK